MTERTENAEESQADPSEEGGMTLWDVMPLLLTYTTG